MSANSAEKVEIATLTRQKGKRVIRVLQQQEVKPFIQKHEEGAKAEPEKKEKEQKGKDK